MPIFKRETDKPGQSGGESYDTLSIFSWIAVGILFFNAFYFVGGEVGAEIYHSRTDVLPIVNAFFIGLLKAGPTILIALAMVEFAFFFHRCGEGAIFTEKNIKTLRSGADSLVWAAVTSAFIIPLVLGWTGEPDAGGLFRFTDLALAVGLMGLALHGFARVFADAVALKRENEEII